MLPHVSGGRVVSHSFFKTMTCCLPCCAFLGTISEIVGKSVGHFFGRGVGRMF